MLNPTSAEAPIHDEFVERFRAKVKSAVRLGDPVDPETTMGPLLNRMQQERVLFYIDTGWKEGGRLAVGGGAPARFERGSYVEPTLFTEVEPSITIAREEIFGPVTAVMPFRSLDEAVTIANNSIYGLAAGIWTSGFAIAHKLARDIDAGVIWGNCYDHAT